jgi:serine/threonine protein kinase
MNNISNNFNKNLNKYTLNFINPTNINPRKIRTINKDGKDDKFLELKPYIIYDSIKNNNIIIVSNIIGEGASSRVHRINYKGNDTKYIIKFTKYDREEYKGLIFHMLLQKYLIKNKKNNLLNMICNIYEIGTCKIALFTNNYYSIMDNCGEELYSYLIKAETSYNLSSIVELMIKLCVCIKIIHDMGYVYLDFKPENFLIDSNGNIKLIDFGLVSKKGSILQDSRGTSQYMSFRFNMHINNINNKFICDVDLDLFSIGCFFIQMLKYFLLGDKNVFKVKRIFFPYSSYVNYINTLNEQLRQILNQINTKNRLNNKYIIKISNIINAITTILEKCITVDKTNFSKYSIDNIIEDLNSIKNSLEEEGLNSIIKSLKSEDLNSLEEEYKEEGLNSIKKSLKSEDLNSLEEEYKEEGQTSIKKSLKSEDLNSLEEEYKEEYKEEGQTSIKNSFKYNGLNSFNDESLNPIKNSSKDEYLNKYTSLREELYSSHQKRVVYKILNIFRNDKCNLDIIIKQMFILCYFIREKKFLNSNKNIPLFNPNFFVVIDGSINIIELNNTELNNTVLNQEFYNVPQSLIKFNHKSKYIFGLGCFLIGMLCIKLYEMPNFINDSMVCPIKINFRGSIQTLRDTYNNEKHRQTLNKINCRLITSGHSVEVSNFVCSILDKMVNPDLITTIRYNDLSELLKDLNYLIDLIHTKNEKLVELKKSYKCNIQNMNNKDKNHKSIFGKRTLKSLFGIIKLPKNGIYKQKTKL